jgi:hypothetical protein
VSEFLCYSPLSLAEIERVVVSLARSPADVMTRTVVSDDGDRRRIRLQLTTREKGLLKKSDLSVIFDIESAPEFRIGDEPEGARIRFIASGNGLPVTRLFTNLLTAFRDRQAPFYVAAQPELTQTVLGHIPPKGEQAWIRY